MQPNECLAPLAVSAQFASADLGALVTAGYRSVIGNRRDDEAQRQLRTSWIWGIFLMLNGRKWLAEPRHLAHEPRPASTLDASTFDEERY